MTEKVDTLIFSDLHLDLPNNQLGVFMSIVNGLEFRRLILLGDVFEDFSFETLTKQQKNFFVFINNLQKERPESEIIWIAGNHDWEILQCHHLLKIKISKEYNWFYEGKKYIALHGHQFDSFLRKYPTCYNIFCFFNKIFHKVCNAGLVNGFIKKIYLKFHNPSHSMARRMIKSKKFKKANIVIFGHSHHIMQKDIKGVRFVNCGSSEDCPKNYVTINGNEIKINNIF